METKTVKPKPKLESKHQLKLESQNPNAVGLLGGWQLAEIQNAYQSAGPIAVVQSRDRLRTSVALLFLDLE